MYCAECDIEINGYEMEEFGGLCEHCAIQRRKEGENE